MARTIVWITENWATLLIVALAGFICLDRFRDPERP